MNKYSDSIGDFMVAMAMDENLGNIKLLERVFTNIDLDNLDEVIERTKLFTGKELDDILNINGETLLNLYNPVFAGSRLLYAYSEYLRYGRRHTFIFQQTD